jgi:integrase
VAAILDLFLDHSERTNSQRTYEWYRDFLDDLNKFQLDGGRTVGELRLSELKTFHVTKWLDSHSGWNTARRGAIVAVKRAFNWAVGEELLAENQNPVKKIRKPRMPRRERFLTADEHAAIFGTARDESFRYLVTALRESGARPGEVSHVTAEMVDLKAGTWTFSDHKTKSKTGRPRVVFLTPRLVEISRELMARHPRGPLFRNRQGEPWNRNSIRCRFRRLRKKLKLGNDVVCYSYRHGFATEALVCGVPIATVAELLGHADSRMISSHYSHLAEKRDYLRQAVVKANEAMGQSGASGSLVRQGSGSPSTSPETPSVPPR